MITRALVLTVLLAPAVAAQLLPDQPPPGLRITVSVSCDFEQRWWELTFYPETRIPLEVRWRHPGMFRDRERSLTRELDEARHRELYALARQAFDEFHLERPPLLLGDAAEDPWMGPRTLTLSALVLDGDLGRVDRVDLAIDLIPGRALPPGAEGLVNAFARHAAPVTLDLDCR